MKARSLKRASPRRHAHPARQNCHRACSIPIARLWPITDCRRISDPPSIARLRGKLCAGHSWLLKNDKQTLPEEIRRAHSTSRLGRGRAVHAVRWLEYQWQGKLGTPFPVARHPFALKSTVSKDTKVTNFKRRHRAEGRMWACWCR